MFVRKKKNSSGTISIQIIDKSEGKYKVIKTIGSSGDRAEVEYFMKRANHEIQTYEGQSVFQFDKISELEFVDTFVNSLSDFKLVGPELLLGKIFDEIGFNQITDDIFRHLVITRLVYPVSKLKTTDYLFKYKGIRISVWSIYRYLDKMNTAKIEEIKQISIVHTQSILGNPLSIVFYDVTTLYFEASKEDDLRKTGFNKDGKHQNPQIVLGLLVSENGYPIDYQIFEGSKYEGDTLQSVITQFEKQYNPDQLVVVADAGMLSQKNQAFLQGQKYRFILGARIKNESLDIKEQILKLNLSNNQSQVIRKGEQNRLIVSYSDKRAHNDAYNRKRGIEKLKNKIKSGKLTKSHINNKGYNKYLKIKGEATIEIDESKSDADSKWDGLKGYLTNTDLDKDDVINKYSQLWQIEKAFRISKSDLQIRPIYHRLKERIEAHVCIAFAACKIYKELERQLKEKNCDLSVESIIDIVKTIYQISVKPPYSNTIYNRLLIKTHEQKMVMSLFGLNSSLH